MSRDNPMRGEKFRWTPGGMGAVYMAVKTPMINGTRPRVTFHCYTAFSHWQKTMRYPLITTIEPYEWTQKEVFGGDSSGVPECAGEGSSSP